MYATTLKALRTAGACYSGYNRLVRALQGRPFSEEDAGRESYVRFRHDEPVALTYIVESNGLDNALWALRAVPDCEKDARLFAVWCARQVQHLMTDPRSLAALDVAERFAKGKATVEELGTAGVAAGAAVMAAAGAAVRAAAAGAAAGAAVRAAVRAAAWDAAWAAWDAAWDAAETACDAAGASASRNAGAAAMAAARAAQKQMFIAMCEGRAPWQTEKE